LFHVFILPDVQIKSALIPNPFSQGRRRGARISQSPSPALGEGFRVREIGKVAHQVILEESPKQARKLINPFHPVSQSLMIRSLV
jgi:hypothetical protein